MEKMGIQETKDCIDLGLAMIECAVQAKKDGKIGVEDAALLLQVIPKVGPAIEGASKVPSELADLESSEAAELVAHVMGKLAIDDAKAKEVIEKSLKAAVSIYDLVKAVKA